MTTQIGVAEVSGINKRVYDKMGIRDYLPGSSILTKRIGWDKGTRNVGESYVVPVELEPPNGFTYLGSSGAVGALKSARNMVIKPASITPFELDLREQVSWTALSRAASQGEGAFAQLAGLIYKAMKKSAANRLEMATLLGQHPNGIGIVESVTDLGSNKANIVITAATWAPGLWWALGRKATLDSFTATTKNNATGALITDGLTTSTRTVRVIYSGTLASECTAGDILYFEGATDGTTATEMPGMVAQLANLASTSLGIDASTYPNWAGNQYNVNGNISADIVEDAVSQLRDRMTEGKLSLYLANKPFGVLVNEFKALRIIDSSYSPEKGKVGFKSIQIVSPDIGEIEVVNHPFMPQGEFLLFSEDDAGRVGSSDLTFGVPGMQSEDLFRLLDGYNAAEIALFTDQCVIHKAPAHGMWGFGITYT